MSECRWTYYDPTQGTQTLGLYHGNESGHVMIYHNEKVVIVDFMVYSSKSYSFMFNDNLIKLDLNQVDGKFEYKFMRTRPKEPEVSAISRFRKFIQRPFIPLAS